jgi:iron complex outermembrane receptor protein
MKTITSTTLLIAFMFSLFAEPKSEETEAIYQLPDLTVKATLWDSELYKTEQSVSLIEAQSIELSGSQHFQDLIDSIPNLTFTGGTARPRYFQIRGIGENSQFEGETPDASVRFLIDDFDFTGLGGSAALFNVQQVEVLRGPQAGAFGANAAAGSIQILSKELTKENSGAIQFSLGNDNLRTTALSQAGPLDEGQSDSILYGITLSQTSSNGFVKNQFLDRTDTNAKDEKFALLKFYYKPNDSVTVEPAFIYTNFNNGYDEWSLQNIPLTTYSNVPGRDEQRSRGASLKLTSKKPATFSFVSITSLLDTDSLYSYDSDWGAIQDDYTSPILLAESGYSGHQTIHRDRENFSQEFRIDSAERMESPHSNKQWTVGAYFSTLDEYSNFDYIESGSLAAKVDSRYQTETTSFYAQLASKLSQKSKLELGFRYEEHSVDFESHSPNTYYGTLVEGSKVKNKDHLRGAKLAFFNELNSQDTLFASITKGYKSGGANSSSFIGASDPLSYIPEDLMNYELGISHLSSDQRFRSKINLFYLERENAQIRDSEGTTGLFRYFTTNEGDAQHYGLEYQSDWKFKRNLSLHSEIGLLKAKLDDRNRDLANAPSYSYGLKLLYTPESGYFGSLSLNGSDDYFEENSHDFRRDAFEVIHASCGFQSDSMTLTFWVNNLFEQNYSKRVFYFDNWNPSHSGERDYQIQNSPRTYGIHLSFNW